MGRWLFPRRLWVGLAIAVGALEWLVPVPPFSTGHQVQHALALGLILTGLGLRAWAAGCAGGHTRSAQIEAPRLVVRGPYARVRNPIYLGTIGLSLGMAWLIGDPLALGLAVAALGLMYLAIVAAEESFLAQQFGDHYRRYCAAVPRLLPRVHAWTDGEAQPFRWRATWGEAGILLWLLVIYAVLWGKEYLDGIW
jgi:protein-S-isoprenylcysteine O-methyltransferase Ste14